MAWTQEEAARIYKAADTLIRAKGRNPDPAMCEAFTCTLESAGVAFVNAMRAFGRALATPGWQEPAHLLRFAGVLPEESDLRHRAELAFVAVDRARRSVGPYKSPDFDDPLVNAMVNQHPGGWEAVCEIDGESWSVWFRRWFVDGYCRLGTHGVPRESIGPCLGYFDRLNQFHGVSGAARSYKRVVQTGLKPHTCLKVIENPVGIAAKSTVILEHKKPPKQLADQRVRAPSRVLVKRPSDVLDGGPKKSPSDARPEGEIVAENRAKMAALLKAEQEGQK